MNMLAQVKTEADLHQHLYNISGQVHNWETCATKISAAPGCGEFFTKIRELYESGVQALEGIQRAPKQKQRSIYSSLAFVYGCTEYGDVVSMVRYHADIARFGISDPSFLNKVLEFAGRHEGNARLMGRVRNRATHEGFVPGDENLLMLGSLLAQPTKTAKRLDLFDINHYLPFFKQYVDIAKVADRSGLSAFSEIIAKSLSQHPFEAAHTGESFLALRKIIFGDALISSRECEYRLESIASSMQGLRKSESATANELEQDFQALAASEMTFESIFKSIYESIYYEGIDFGDSGEKVAESPSSSLNMCMASLQGILSKLGLDYRAHLAPWVLERNISTWTPGDESRNDDLWLDREVVRAATEESLSGRAQVDIDFRRIAWIARLTPERCLALCENDDQLMTCYKATGHSQLAKNMKSERYYDEILATDLGI